MKNILFTPVNNFQICGKIVKILQRKKCKKFIISCGHNGPIRKNKDGLILRDLVTVSFFNKDAEYYESMYKEGDFVSVNGVVQNVRNRVNNTSHVEFWGLTMSSAWIKNKKKRDCNEVNIKGKIESAHAISDNYLIINVYTLVERSRPNNNPDSDINKLTDTYRSITPVGIRCDGDAKELEKSVYTLGTWVDVKAFIYGKTRKKNDNITKIERIIAKKIDIVGEVQTYARP